MVLARYKAVPNIKRTGIFGGKPLVAFTSEEVSGLWRIHGSDELNTNY